MATPLNVFKTVSVELTTSGQLLYTVPADVTTIVLSAQITNVTSTVAQVTFWFENSVPTAFELVKDFYVPKNDVVSGLVGKLVLEPGFTLNASASANSTLKITLSLLETSNV